MRRYDSLLRTGSVCGAALALMTVSASAMHMAEGYLRPWAFGWMAVCLPFLAAGFLLPIP